MKNKLLVAALSSALYFTGAGAFATTSAAPAYDAMQSYSAGSVVLLEGHAYRAKWWANPGQSPAELAAVMAAWETPWERLADAAGSVDPAVPPIVDTLPVTTPTPVDAGQGSVLAPAYDAAASYIAGKFVTFQDVVYRAKWYANPGQSPADVATAANPWDTPWEVHAGPIDPVDGGSSTTPPEVPSPVQPPSAEPVVIKASELAAQEATIASGPLMDEVKRSIATLGNAAVDAITPERAANPANVRRVEAIVSESGWEFFFPQRAKEYTYRGFLQAVGKFPAFCGDFTDGRDADAICRKSLATMFAHFAQETGGHNGDQTGVPNWRQGLVHVREMGWDESKANGYAGECLPSTWQGATWPCGKFADGSWKSYFGRGAKQLSYNYNYGPFSDAMFGDVRVLLDNPEQVADTWLNLASAVFFFVYPQPPKPSMQHVVDGTWVPNERDLANGLAPGFGTTIQVINGGVECGGSSENQQSLNRIAFYREFARELGVEVPADEVLGCKGMKQFDEGSAAALPIYWEKDFSWSSETPTGETYKCQLVSYQTPFTAFKKGDYARCVTKHYPDVSIDAEH